MTNDAFRSLKDILTDLRLTPNQLLFLHIITEKREGGDRKTSAINWYRDYLSRVDSQIAPVTSLDIEVLVSRNFISYIGADDSQSTTEDFIISADYEKYIDKLYKNEKVEKFGLELFNSYPAFIKVDGKTFSSRNNISLDYDNGKVSNLIKSKEDAKPLTQLEFCEYYYTKIEGSEETHKLLLEALDYIKKTELKTNPKETFFNHGLIKFIATDRFRTAIDCYTTVINSGYTNYADFDKTIDLDDQM